MARFSEKVENHWYILIDTNFQIQQGSSKDLQTKGQHPVSEVRSWCKHCEKSERQNWMPRLKYLTIGGHPFSHVLPILTGWPIGVIQCVTPEI